MRKLMILILLLAACGGEAAEPTSLTRSQTALEVLPVAYVQDNEEELPTLVPDTVMVDADAEHLLLTNIYERSAPSVVNIEVEIRIGGPTGFTDVARGSGFIWGRNGHIITNAHVVDNAEEILVTFNDGYVTGASLVGEDVYSDLAVIQVDVPLTRLLPLELADSDMLHVGERAIAIGNPFGLSSSMTVGIISGLGRQLRSAELIDNTVAPGFQNPNIIQVDTDINPGNSGGPLLNSRGQVIGVNTAISSETGIFQGVGFAVPANTVGRVVPELIENGEVAYSWMGISTERTELGVAALREPLGLPVEAGVLVRGITPDSPADEAGLVGGDQRRSVRGNSVCAGGDIIVAVDGNFIGNMDELVSYLVINTRPGDTVTLLVVRDDETFDVPLTLRGRPDGGVAPPRDCDNP